MDDDTYQKVRDYALKLLSLRPRGTSEMSQKVSSYCRKRKIPPEAVARLLQDFTNSGFLNDEEFVRWWILQRRGQSKPKGTKFILHELLGKGISRDILEKVFYEEDHGIDTDFGRARALAAKRKKVMGKMPAKEMRIKLGNYLGRRGFDWEIVDKVLDEVVTKGR